MEENENNSWLISEYILYEAIFLHNFINKNIFFLVLHFRIYEVDFGFIKFYSY